MREGGRREERRDGGKGRRDEGAEGGEEGVRDAGQVTWGLGGWG